jgi:rubrerythrin
VCILEILNYNEAMFIACEMERGAIRHYARAMQLLKTLGRETEPIYQQLKAMHAEEQSHLENFSGCTCLDDLPLERQTLLTAMMNGWLFEGGLMGAARSGMMDDIPSMLKYAMESEALSAKKYREFAKLAADEKIRSTLLGIAAEEDAHLLELKAQEDAL